MKAYDHKKIEKKWQKAWEKSGIYEADAKSKKPKFYSLIEFPYPSGEGLHVGHPRPYIGMDLVSRKRRMEGYNVLYPIGWDAFGLPTENYAIKTGIHPSKVTKKNTDNFRRQIKLLGTSFDWSREVNTTDPKYYRWTQWIFLQMYKHGLAYKKKMVINWCPKDKIGLANEEVINGNCERCGTAVEKREKEQWMLAITKYAERLDKDLDTVDYSERIKTQQRNWIGKSEGAELQFSIKNSSEKIKVFTTRADTLFGVTYVVLAPEHELIKKLQSNISNIKDVEKYITDAKKKDEIARTAEDKEKTGVELKGIKAINPANNEEVPVYVADYVLGHYGTGAVMAVPAHDERDYAFAKKYKLSMKEVVVPERVDKANPPIAGKRKEERKNVQIIVRNPKNNQVLLLKWRKFPWIAFPMGGIEGEDVLASAAREVTEETGFKNLTNGKILGGQVKAEYYAAHKDLNRVSYTYLVSFDLVNDEQQELSDEDKDRYDYMWVPMNKLAESNLVHAEKDVWFERLAGRDLTSYTGTGVLINSGAFNGMDSEKVKKAITEKVGGKMLTTFKLRDWVFSRQRYWGEPIPMIHCKDCGWVAVPEKDLPVKLPNIKNYLPTDNGDSPLATLAKWVNTKCPTCKGPAQRETDTMPNWAGSSWYYLRYADPKNSKAFASPEALKYWTPVDWYNGGMEHTTLHLLYSRFWHKFLFDQKLVPTSEPYKKRTSHGLILAEGGEKMSKSRGNVVNPDSIVEQFGADTLRVYEMFMGPFDQAVAWSTDGIVGSKRFLEKVWRLQEKVQKGENKDVESLVHRTVKKVGEDIESMQFNTAISALMILANEMDSQTTIPQDLYEIFIKILSPFAPHISEELWSNLKHKITVHLEPWPIADMSKIALTKATIAVQVNGKVRASIQVETDTNEELVKGKALADADVKKWIEGKKIQRVIYVKNRLINIVISDV